MALSNPRQHVRKKQIRAMVQSFHDQLRVDGEYKLPIPVEKIAKSLDVRVIQVDAQDDDLSGFFYRDPANGKAIIGINNEHSRTRQRFTMAHEIGHLVLHSFDDLHYDRKGYGTGYGRVRRRDAESATGENRDEIEANYFAAELLMPEDLVYEKLADVGVLDMFDPSFNTAIKSIAKEFEVSPLALQIRMSQLGILATT